MTLQGAEFTDLHATCPAFFGGGSAAHLACHHKLRLWVTVQPKSLKLIKQKIFITCCLHEMHMQLMSGQSTRFCFACCEMQSLSVWNWQAQAAHVASTTTP